jgi:hypothetical protein
MPQFSFPARAAGWLAGAVAILLLAPPHAQAQFERSQISGVVKDSTGGVLPGVTVTATDLQTQTPRTTVSDGSGFYTFPNLQPGRYDVSAELTGFKKHVESNVQLDAAGSLTLELTLETGNMTEAVTVTAESTPLQSDVAVRKTVEAKDIEQMALNGRNPIGVAGLKAGVIGGSFNNYGFNNLGNGGFNINGSRPDENNITIDGATAIRTRSSGAIIGIQNVDAVQEVQVLTANYLPEYGRSSGGQIRMVTKSGSNRYSGSGSFFYRDDSLQANSWSRNSSPNPLLNSGPAPFDYKQYGYSFGGPVPLSALRDKLFFFTAQEWVNFYQDQTQVLAVPTELMRQGNFSELLDPNNGFFSGARVITNPSTGQPFPGNIIDANLLSPTGMAFLRAFPSPTPGFRQGANNAIITSPNPQDQRKDNIRLDYRLNDRNQFTYRFSRYNWVAVDAFRGGMTFARTDWERPNFTSTASWTTQLSSSLINEATYTFSRDDVFINVFEEGGVYQRSKYGINYPYVFQEKEITDKIPTVSISGFQEIDGGPYPASSSGPIHTVSNTTTWVKGRHTLKGGLAVEYSGEDDFDQINVNATPGGTNNQNGRFEFRDARSGGTTGLSVANAAMGLFTNYAELGQRNFTKWRSLATDVFLQDSWKPTSALTIEGGFRWVYWPPWYSTTNNIANFDPRFYDRAQAAVMDPTTGRLVAGPRYNGMVLPGDGFEGDAQQSVVAQDPAVLALFRGEPRGFSQTHANAFEPRFGAAYKFNEKTVLRMSTGIFHNRVTLNDSTLLGGNVPFQPQVTISNGIADNPGGGTVGSKDLPFTVTSQDAVFKHPTAYMYSVGIQRELPFGFTADVSYVGRKGLYLQRERNLNQLLPGTIQANPDVNIAALRPYAGYGVIRLSENAGRSNYHSLQVSADRRYTNGLKVGFAYTLGKSEDNGSDKRNVLWNTYDDSIFWGPSNYDRRHVLAVYYIYDLPFFREQSGVLGNVLGGWQVSGASFFRTGTPFSVVQTSQDVAGVGDVSVGQPWDLVGDPKANTNGQLSTSRSDQNFWFNPAAFAPPAPGTFGNAPRNLLYNPGEQQWDLAIFKNFNLGGTRRLQLRGEFFNFPNHPNLGEPSANVSAQTGNVNSYPVADPTNGDFGRVTRKSGQRDIQLSVRFQF